MSLDPAQGDLVPARMVWAASYPKSGNTWLRAVYTAAVTGAGPDINQLADGDIESSRAMFDRSLGVRSSDLTHEETWALRPAADEMRTAQLRGMPWTKVHDALRMGPGGRTVVSVTATHGAVYLLRDPRDVAVSLSYHLGVSLPQAVEVLRSQSVLMSSQDRLTPQLPQYLGTWSEHVTSWVDHDMFPVCVLRYEDCLADPAACFARALATGGVMLGPEDVAKAVERSSLASLQDQERRSGFREAARGTFFRRGKAGAWREELPTDLARQVEADHRQVMQRFGYL